MNALRDEEQMGLLWCLQKRGETHKEPSGLPSSL